MASTRRFPGAMLSALPVASLSRWRALILACIALITVLAWVYLVHLGRQISSEG